MIGPFFQRALDAGELALVPGETLDDVVSLYTIIVDARRETANGGEQDELIALVALCFFVWPGKSPRYRRTVPKFRRKFAGISRRRTLRTDFRARLKQVLLSAPSASDLPLNAVDDLFIVKDEERDTFVEFELSPDPVKPGKKLPALPGDPKFLSEKHVAQAVEQHVRQLHR